MWITVTEASKLCKCSERTLRHYAVKGQLRTGKKGKKWLLYFGDLIKKGLISEDDAKIFKSKHQNLFSEQAPTPGIPITPSSEVIEINLPPLANSQTSVVHSTNSSTANKENLDAGTMNNIGKTQRYKRVDQIGVFNELLTVFKTNSSHFKEISQNELVRPVNEQLVSVLKLISMGFFENNSVHKSHHFREAKNILARIVIDLKLVSFFSQPTPEVESNLNHNIEIQFQESIIPGLIGLINRTEKRSFQRNDSSLRKNG